MVRTGGLLFIGIAIALVGAGCRSAMSVDEARRVTAAFTGRAFVPPPRTVHDILDALEQHKRAETAAVTHARRNVDQSPPGSSDAATLAEFYYQRGLAARELGRFKQELADLSQAAEHSRRIDILVELSGAHFYGGNVNRAREIRQEIAALRGAAVAGWQIGNQANLARLHAIVGDLEAADAASDEAHRLLYAARGRQGRTPDAIAAGEANVATARATVAEARGRFEEAANFYRESIAILSADSRWTMQAWVDLQVSRLALVLIRQGRLLEAENEARRAVLGTLGKRGRNSKETATMVRVLSRAIVEQGRYMEAEALARASLDIYARIGAPPDSYTLALARSELLTALVGQGRWTAAIAEYERLREALRGDFAMLEHGMGHVGYRNNAAIAYLKTGEAERAVAMLTSMLERDRATIGEAHTTTAETRGLLAAAQAAAGDHAGALASFTRAVPVLIDRTEHVDDEATTAPAREERLRLIFGAYVTLLARIRGTELERAAGIDAVAEAFRVAEAARGTAVQRSLDAAAARAVANTPGLADLVRREQDARRQLSALYGLVASALSSPDGDDAPNVGTLRQQIAMLTRARKAIAGQLERDFPAYTQLINPRPLTVDGLRSRLRPDDAVIATYVDDDETFVWAIRATGAVAFTAARLGRAAVRDAVGTLRRALDPSARTLGDIPAFDVLLAHWLYTALLEPVSDGWREAGNLLIVPHGPLAQLPFGLLPTRATAMASASAPLFAEYRHVPWLVRSHAITVLPSATALATLRALPPGDSGRRPFIGFGDPFFSRAQAAEAAAEAHAVELAADVRERPVALRASPRTQNLGSSRLAMLPRLPDTAEEIRSIALTLGADLAREVVVGALANEKTVKDLDLASYRVVAFATHGLVPGDLDGLTQPALALSAPDVADIDGDGLLTMDEILGLRLNADWIILSACNTASGHGAGTDALSGLGRAFMYAGARTLLVSNWPVETTSARELTTDVFRRQKTDPDLSRAQALQEAMKALIDGPGFVDGQTNTAVFSYAHPIFWAPFALVGDGGGNAR